MINQAPQPLAHPLEVRTDDQPLASIPHKIEHAIRPRRIAYDQRRAALRHRLERRDGKALARRGEDKYIGLRQQGALGLL